MYGDDVYDDRDILLWILSNQGDKNKENVKRQWVYLSKATIVHVHHAFGSFYLTSTAQIRREIRTCYETFCSVAGRERIFVFVLNLDKVRKIQTRFRLYSISKVSEVNKCDKV